ncbi:transcription initiation factor IIB family protein [Natronomonas gomsonensis]|uniref:transcription initiation factor IIB family protein n=1 Tax=Natronomonas gomsonensis TaxID=1046043 RepID=UPI0015BA061D|nr:transcription initiation factor IIB family protein [Natronomonas gomsonensis]
MNSKKVIKLEDSVESETNEADAERVVDVRGASWQSRCPECEGRVHQRGHESVCDECGLVIAVETLDRTPTLKDHAPTTDDRSGEWSCEPTNQLRVDKGLVTTFFLNTDGKGNQLSSERKDRMERLRRRHKRFTMHNRRNQRLNEGMRDIGMLGANLSIPEHVQTDASRYLKAAKRERLPGGRMPWEGLAAGAMLLATRNAGIERDPVDVAQYAKASLDRVCAGARKIRLETEVEAPPVRDRAVDRVVAALDDVLDVEAAIELVRVGERLLEVADREAIGSGTHRMAMAGAAVYAADRLTSEKHLTQAEVVAAASTVVPTSKSQIRSYSREVHDIGQARLQSLSNDALPGLVQAD